MLTSCPTGRWYSARTAFSRAETPLTRSISSVVPLRPVIVIKMSFAVCALPAPSAVRLSTQVPPSKGVSTEHGRSDGQQSMAQSLRTALPREETKSCTVLIDSPASGARTAVAWNNHRHQPLSSGQLATQHGRG